MKLLQSVLLSLLIFVYNQFDGDGINLRYSAPSAPPPPPHLSGDNSVLKTSGEGTCLTVRMVQTRSPTVSFQKAAGLRHSDVISLLVPRCLVTIGLNEAYTAKT